MRVRRGNSRLQHVVRLLRGIIKRQSLSHLYLIFTAILPKWLFDQVRSDGKLIKTLDLAALGVHWVRLYNTITSASCEKCRDYILGVHRFERKEWSEWNVVNYRNHILKIDPCGMFAQVHSA